MKQHYIKLIGLFTFLVVGMVLSGCGQLSNLVPTATAYPTYTPVSTYTPVPTYTPFPTIVPSRWEAQVLSVTTPADFDGYVPERETSRYLVVTIEYTYQGPDPIVFSPESVVLMNITSSGPSRLYGWSNTPNRYQPENVSSSIGLNVDSYTIEISPGTTRVDRFGWVFPKDLTEFRLFFPETGAIDITVN